MYAGDHKRKGRIAPVWLEKKNNYKLTKAVGIKYLSQPICLCVLHKNKI